MFVVYNSTKLWLVCRGSVNCIHVRVQESVYVKFVSEAAAGQGFKLLHGWTYDGTAISYCRSYILSAFCLTDLFFHADHRLVGALV